MTPVRLIADGGDTLLDIKAVPGAKSPGIAGALGERLKIKVGAPPEGGKANTAIRRILARTLGVSLSDITVEHGASDAHKTLRISGCSTEDVRTGLGL
ncbi:MAG: hypothetical protein Tsb0013_06140 [Phycisphaerales bacterium]